MGAHRSSEKLNRRTEQLISTYHGKLALLETWEAQSEEVQIREHAYILGQRKQVRNLRNYIAHRSDPDAEI